MMAVRDRLHVTTVVVTHDMRTARRLGQHIMMLYRGKIHAKGPPDEFFNSQDPIVRQFVDGVADPKESLLMQTELPTAFVRKVG
jgi:phospholipid/cholesterol/gamma-HCH transport system ATP-binding protein